MVALLNCARMILLVWARLVMFVVRQVPTFMPWAAKTSFKLVLSAGFSVGVGVASVEACWESSVEEVSAEDSATEEVSVSELDPDEEFVFLPASHPTRDRMSRPVVSSKILFFFMYDPSFRAYAHVL